MDTAAKLPRILLVDDHPDTVAIMSLVLTRRGYSVVRAYSVAAARAAAETHQCDLLITDGNLPDGNGIELMRELKAKHSMPAMLVSGSLDNGKSVESEGFKYLRKPVDLARLLDAIQSMEPQASDVPPADGAMESA